MTEIVKEFVTPDRGSQSKSLGKQKGGAMERVEMSKQAATVTPAESSREETKATADRDVSPLAVASRQLESPEDRKVRFDKTKKVESLSDSPSSTDSQRGLVSRRGGRISSPGRVANTSPKKETVLEFKAFSSPKQDTNDSVPSLSSDASPKKSTPAAYTAIEKAATSTTPKKGNVTFSPVPPPRTPVRSPAAAAGGSRFQSLPTLDDDALRSPGSFFLSPNTPSSRTSKSEGPLDKALTEKENSVKEEDLKPAARQVMRSPKTPRSPRTPKRDDRERFLATPTDFATDYGKHTNSGSFDQSNGMSSDTP